MKIGSLKEFKDFFPIVVDIPVAWGEMDSMQHVNHTVYLKWMETARFEFFEKMGMINSMEETGVGNILKSIECRYRIPLTHPDNVSVGAKLSEVRDDEYLMDQAVFSHTHSAVAAEAQPLMVMYDYQELRKTVIPPLLRKRLLELK